NVGEAFVVAKVEVRLRAVVRDENLPMLKGAHRSGVHVQVRIAFLDGDFEAATFEETADGGCCYAFAEGRNYTTSYKDIFWRHPGRSHPRRADLSLSNLRRIDVHIIMFGTSRAVNANSSFAIIGVSSRSTKPFPLSRVSTIGSCGKVYSVACETQDWPSQDLRVTRHGSENVYT